MAGHVIMVVVVVVVVIYGGVKEFICTQKEEQCSVERIKEESEICMKATLCLQEQTAAFYRV